VIEPMGGTSVELATLPDVARFIGHCHLGAKHILVRPRRIPVPRSVSPTGEPGGVNAKRGAELIFGLVLAADAASTRLDDLPILHVIANRPTNIRTQA